MKNVLALFVAFLLVGCATTENYEKILRSWIGSSEGALISSWGAPDSNYTSGDRTYLTYVRSGSMTIPGTAPTYQTQVIGNTAYTTSYGGSPATTIGLHCKTTFTVSNGRITNWRYQGNHCVAHAPN